MFSLVVDFDYVYNTRHILLPVEQALNPINKVVGYPMSIFIITVPGCAWCLVGWYLHTQGPALRYTTASPWTYIAPSSKIITVYSFPLWERFFDYLLTIFPPIFFHSLLVKKNWHYSEITSILTSLLIFFIFLSFVRFVLNFIKFLVNFLNYTNIFFIIKILLFFLTRFFWFSVTLCVSENFPFACLRQALVA